MFMLMVEQEEKVRIRMAMQQVVMVALQVLMVLLIKKEAMVDLVTLKLIVAGAFVTKVLNPLEVAVVAQMLAVMVMMHLVLLLVLLKGMAVQVAMGNQRILGRMTVVLLRVVMVAVVVVLWRKRMISKQIMVDQVAAVPFGLRTLNLL